ncbi:MAG: RNA polymerase Rpb4 family protein [Thermoplasmata archaeon]|nr:RNA polymerase Rpb4 family protein [Thermoplasmata archaeon]
MNKKYVTLAEVRELLEEISKERELTDLQKNTLKHAEEFSKIKVQNVKKLKDKLMKLEIVNEKYAVKILDIMPRTPDEVRSIFLKDKIVPTPEDIQKILEILWPKKEEA